MSNKKLIGLMILIGAAGVMLTREAKTVEAQGQVSAEFIDYTDTAARIGGSVNIEPEQKVNPVKPEYRYLEFIQPHQGVFI